MSSDRPFIVAFDISKTCTGICEGYPGDKPTFHSLRNGEGVTARKAVKRLGDWIIDRSRLDHIDIIAIEAAIHPGAWKGEWDAEKQKVVNKQDPMSGLILSKLVTIVEYIADKKDIPTVDANVQTVRSKFLGHGRPSEPKRRAMAMCRALGWEPNNQDQSDAGAVWWWACMTRAPRFYQPITPMLQQQVNSPFNAADAAMNAPRRKS